MRMLIDKLRAERRLTRDEFIALAAGFTPGDAAHAAGLARAVARGVFGNRIFVRGLIEFTNYCRNDCFYCGIRRSNPNVSRYRLEKDEILACCRVGAGLGFRTYVLQGGEDPWYDDDRLAAIVAAIRREYPDCAITLSAGERSRESYLRLREAGADRYLLRHETADPEHYALLHPGSLSLENRKRCLRDLKEIGYQTGAGFMVGSPFQEPRHIAEDLLFLKDLQPEMVGIGPFIPHHDTPFARYPAGSVDLTLFLLSLVRLMLPEALLPATTALGTMDTEGREKGVLAGANVLMPNLSPAAAKARYTLYDNKIHSGDEAAENVAELRRRMEGIGYRLAHERGDWKAAPL